jgi:hypothetical protein
LWYNYLFPPGIVFFTVIFYICLSMYEEHTLSDLLALFFYEKGYLSIPKLGTFASESGAAFPVDSRPGNRAGSISFSYDPNQAEDAELVDFITAKTRKMRPVAQSDLLSLSGQAKETLNTGQSFTLAGVATVIPEVRGGFAVEGDPSPHHLAAKRKEPPAFNTARKPPFREGHIHSSGGRRTVAGVAMTLVCVALGALLVYFLFFHGPTSPSRTGHDARETHALGDTPPTRTDAAAHPDGLLHYEAIFERATGEFALARYRQLTAWGHPVILETTDSVHYLLAVRMSTPAADTSFVKDSLSRLYGHPVDIRLLP